MSAFQSLASPLLLSFGAQTPQTAQLQSIYYCSIMEDVATCERPGTQHMNANEPASHTKRAAFLPQDSGLLAPLFCYISAPIWLTHL